RTVADGLDYTEVTTYATVPGGALGVKLVPASGGCDAPGVLEATVDLAGDAATLLITGRPSPDAGTAGSLRVRALPDHGGLLLRPVDTVESAPALDEWLTATSGSDKGRSVRSAPGLTYAGSTAPVSATVVADGYGSTSGMSLDWFSTSL